MIIARMLNWIWRKITGAPFDGGIAIEVEAPKETEEISEAKESVLVSSPITKGDGTIMIAKLKLKEPDPTKTN